MNPESTYTYTGSTWYSDSSSSLGTHLHYSPSTTSHRGVDITSPLILSEYKEQIRKAVLQELFGKMVEGELRMVMKVGGHVVMNQLGADTSRQVVVATKDELTPIDSAVVDVPKVEEKPEDKIQKGWHQDDKGELYEYLGNGKWSLPTGVDQSAVVKKYLAGELEFLN